MLDEPDLLVCPYTGLRTFTEDEAIYFRGREAHIGKCINLLAQEHYLMITGASGDGKSSLVYAGLLPEIRAGFFRVRFSSWAVCTFRPERQPLRNLARALATGLRLSSSTEAVETELSQGFSALVDLYRASPLFPDETQTAESSVSLPGQRRARPEAANLLLVLDQFEEFFTNAENYDGAAPSTAAQTVVNLLLETTRLAREQGLPIYIVCTMRSDFIGQCAEFRGLVELIGESQYFVPRLTRAEFVEIIREPAVLSGNRIADRLVQRLVDDNRDGRDQLPVLQHALYQIWQAASQGREEMDLVHYAMVGGMLPIEIPWEHRRAFADWRATLSRAQEINLLAAPSLHNVLDAHANQLYAEAADQYNRDFRPSLPPGTAERVVEQTFRALTKVDAQRVVRNRMTGAEITAIIADAALPWSVVCRILRPFRQPGNTFLSPFLLDGDDDMAVLPPDTVLDITHESLIRNWQRLAEWALQEADDVRTVSQLTTQAQSWATHAGDAGYLLSIGPYSQFAKWYRRKQPNASWLTYYVAEGSPGPERQVQAEAQSELMNKYLLRSKRRLQVPLFVAEHGAGRLATYVLVPLLMASLIWFGWSQRVKHDDYVASTLIEQRLPLLSSPYISVDAKATFLVNAERLRPFTYHPMISSEVATDSFTTHLDRLKKDTLALDIELAMYQKANNFEYDTVTQENPLARQVLFDLAQRFDSAGSRAARRTYVLAQQRHLAVRRARYIMQLTHYLVYTDPHPLDRTRCRAFRRNDNAPLAALKGRQLDSLLAYVRREAETTSGRPPSPEKFGYVLRVLLGQGNFSATQLAFLNNIYPFRAGSYAQFCRLFPRQYHVLPYTEDPGDYFGHGDGYQAAGIMAAALHRPLPEMLQCLDSVKLHDYTSEKNYSRLIQYFIKYKYFTYERVKPVLSCLYNQAVGAGLARVCAQLLSVAPLQGSVANYCSYRYGSWSLDYLYLDYASCLVPATVRNSTWEALQRALPELGDHAPVFTTLTNPSTHIQGEPAVTRAFLQAYLAKQRAIYENQIARNDSAATRFLAVFKEWMLADALHVPTPYVSLKDWDFNNGLYIGEEYNAFRVKNCRGFLLSTSIPRSQNLGFRTGDATVFFDFITDLRVSWQLTAAEAMVIKRTIYHECWMPDRALASTTFMDFDKNFSWVVQDALRSPKRQLPSLHWVKNVNRLAGTKAERRRHDFLLKVLAATYDWTDLLGTNVQTYLAPEAKTMLATAPAHFHSCLTMALSDLAAAMAGRRRIPEALAIAAVLPGDFATLTKVRIAEQVMYAGNEEDASLTAPVLTELVGRFKAQPEKAPGSLVGPLFWQDGSNSQMSAWKAAGQFYVKEGDIYLRQRGLEFVLRGQSLSGEAYRAVAAVPAYIQDDEQQRDFNLILQNLAHANVSDGGWTEYDRDALYAPVDYEGPTLYQPRN